MTSQAAAATGRRSRCPRCRRPWSDTLARCGWCGSLLQALPCGRHPTRVTTQACVVCGVPVCSRCAHGRRWASLCETHASVKVVEGWAEVARFEDELQADMMARALRAALLEAQVLSQKDHANVVGFGGLAVIRVLVPGHQYQAGVDMLRERDLEEGAP